MVPPHTTLESNDDRREVVRRRAVPVTVSAATAAAVVLAVGFLTRPMLSVVVVTAVGAGIAFDRRC